MDNDATLSKSKECRIHLLQSPRLTCAAFACLLRTEIVEVSIATAITESIASTHIALVVIISILKVSAIPCVLDLFTRVL